MILGDESSILKWLSRQHAPKKATEEPRVERVRRLIEEAYLEHPTGCGNSFGEILCWELHTNGKTFRALADKWGISLPTLGELVSDHCKRLESDPVVEHQY